MQFNYNESTLSNVGILQIKDGENFISLSFSLPKKSTVLIDGKTVDQIIQEGQEVEPI